MSALTASFRGKRSSVWGLAPMRPWCRSPTRTAIFYYEDLTAQALEQILDDLAAGKPVKMGPVTGRACSEPTEADVAVLAAAELYDGSRAKPLPYLPNSPEAKAAEAGEDPHPVKKARPARKAPDADEAGGAVKSAPRKTSKAADAAKTGTSGPEKVTAKAVEKKTGAKKGARRQNGREKSRWPKSLRRRNPLRRRMLNNASSR